MQIIHLKKLFMLALLVGAVGFAGASVARANNLPQLQNCSLQPPAGNEMFYRVFAVGVQVYRWNGTSWDFVGPLADLFADPNYQSKVGIHYGGPTWQSVSGSKVVAARSAECPGHPSAIPWLLLHRVSAQGPGVFSDVSFIQRVNTVGGLRPVVPGQAVGAEARVPYKAEYYFFRQIKN